MILLSHATPLVLSLLSVVNALHQDITRDEPLQSYYFALASDKNQVLFGTPSAKDSDSTVNLFFQTLTSSNAASALSITNPDSQSCNFTLSDHDYTFQTPLAPDTETSAAAIIGIEVSDAVSGTKNCLIHNQSPFAVTLSLADPQGRKLREAGLYRCGATDELAWAKASGADTIHLQPQNRVCTPIAGQLKQGLEALPYPPKIS